MKSMSTAFDWLCLRVLPGRVYRPRSGRNENSPALQRWVKGRLTNLEPAKRATEFPVKIVDFKPLPSVSRTCDPIHVLIPALKRWAIFAPSAIADEAPLQLFGQSSFNRVILAAVLLFLFCAAAVAQAKTPPADPTLKLQTLDGKVVDLGQQRGDVMLISFGATWCGPCTIELHSLNEVLSEYRGRPVKFYWVSIERPEEVTNGDLKRYARERKLAFPVLRDTGQMVFLQFAEKVRLPMLVLLDKQARVVGPATFGMKSRPEEYKAEIRARLNKLLTERSEAEQ